MIIFNYFSEYNGTMYTCDVVQPEDRYVLIAGIIAAVVLNIVLGLISWWRCYANNYLHWGALATWCLLLVQGCVFYGLRAKRDQEDLIRPTQQLYGFETFICIINLFVTSKNESTNSPIHEFKLLHKGKRAF